MRSRLRRIIQLQATLGLLLEGVFFTAGNPGVPDSTATWIGVATACVWSATTLYTVVAYSHTDARSRHHAVRTDLEYGDSPDPGDERQ